MAVVSQAFFDTSVLLAGLIELGPSAESAQALFGVIAASRSRPGKQPKTAWHCCLEFYAVSTRLPPEFRLRPQDALTLVEREIMERFDVRVLEPQLWLGFMRASAREGIRGGRLYDAHIAEICRQSGSRLVVTENTRHFASLEREGIRVLTAAEALGELRGR